MKLSTCALVLSLLPLVVAFSSTEDLVDMHTGDEIVYYYIDHSCSCRPTPALPTGTYWIITQVVYPAKAGDLDRLVAQYKLFLEQQFESYKAMTHDVVIRYQQTEAMAEASRTQKVETMRGRDYTILEVTFEPKADND